MKKMDPNFPNLPFVSDAEFETWDDKQKQERDALEVAEAARIFGARLTAGMDIFQAAENLPVARMNRRGTPQAQLRALYRT